MLLISTTLLLGIGLVGCSTTSSKSTESSSTKENSVSLTSESTTELSTKTSPTSIEELSEATQLSMDQMIKENKMLSDTYSSISVSTEGKDTLVYTYTFKEDIPEESKQALKESLEQQSEQLVNATKIDAENFKTIIPEFKSKYIYSANDGQILFENLITEKDYNK